MRELIQRIVCALRGHEVHDASLLVDVCVRCGQQWEVRVKGPTSYEQRVRAWVAGQDCVLTGNCRVGAHTNAWPCDFD